MSVFKVEFAPPAERDLKRLNPKIRLQLLRASRVLQEAPYPGTSARVKVLVGIIERHFRLRVGDYRIVYRIEGPRVIVVRVAHRREAYR
ncbi:type II toxin-antitoxin system RelE/ParE family toxin [Candidatus Uhrbacteria bacterium]|nr:type II toxin-antitoxin system RelE/ParE family toxin [Candidatus Uhrbacteria bacterium]